MVQRELEREVLSMLVLSPDVARSDSVLAAEEETNLAPKGASSSSDSAKEDSTNRVTPISACPPNCPR